MNEIDTFCLQTIRLCGKRYDPGDMEKAVNEVKGGRSMRDASKAFRVPYATLHSRVKGTYSLNIRPGPSSVLAFDEEKKLVNWIIHLSKCGFPVTKEQLLDTVQAIVVKTKKETPFKDGRPGRHWYKAFLKRNHELTERMSQNLTKRRANITEQALEGWFAETGSYLKSKGLDDIGPERIFNMDESAFLLAPKGDKVLVKRGEKAAYNLCNNDKECYTALIAANAAGQMPPPMIVYNYERIPFSITEHFPKGYVIGKSESGWMTKETFFSYIANHFHPWCVKNNIKFPVVLYVDGHSSHLTIELSDFCVENNIELIALLPNATHLMQPLDVAFFRALKKAYKDAVRNWRLANNGESLTKVHFASVLKTAIDTLDVIKISENGFMRCGLKPFSEKAIDRSKLIKSVESSSGDKVTKESACHDPLVSSDQLNGTNFIESNIETSMLKLFQDCYCTGEWVGSIEYKELFNLWLRFKKNSVSIKSIKQQKNSDQNVERFNKISVDAMIHAVDSHEDCEYCDKLLSMDISESDGLSSRRMAVGECSTDDSGFVGDSSSTAIDLDELLMDESSSSGIIHSNLDKKVNDDCTLINEFVVDKTGCISSAEAIYLSEELLADDLIINASYSVEQEDLNGIQIDLFTVPIGDFIQKEDPKIKLISNDETRDSTTKKVIIKTNLNLFESHVFYLSITNLYKI